MQSKTTLPSLSLDRLNLNDINQLMLMVRYADTLPIIESKEQKDQPFQDLCKKLLLDYGRTHSAQTWKAGLFTDVYTREPALDSFEDPKKLAGYNFITHPQLGYGMLVQDEPIMGLLADKLPGVSGYQQITYLGKSMGFLSLKNYRSSNELIKALFHYGLFQNKEVLLAAAADVSPQEYKNMFFKLLLASPHEGMSDAEVSQQLKKLYVPKTNPRQFIHGILTEKKAWGDHPRTNFYLGMLKKLYDAIPEFSIDDPQQQTQLNASYNRLAFLLENARNRCTEKEVFLVLIGYAFDEITFQKMLATHYPANTVQSALKNFIKDNNALDVAPSHVSFAGSGMHAATNAVYAAYDVIKEQKEQKIYIEKNAYFQIPLMLSGIVPGLQPFVADKDLCICLGDKKPEMEEFKEQIVDIMICSFEQNPTFIQTHFGSKDVDKDIVKQFTLREQSGEIKKALVVVIDMTASLFDDTQLAFLMLSHQEDIAAGKLAIVTFNSLNKYFLTGFDKLPAGLLSMFYNENAFPALKKWNDRPDYYGGFSLNDSTVQMLSHVMLHASSDVHEFGHHIRGRTRYVHERLVPTELLTPTNDTFLFIDSPYTTDLYKNSWGFLNIKMNCNRCRTAARDVMIKLEEACNMLGIRYRDGYGYGYTTYLKIGEAYAHEPTAMLRLSLGMESTEELNELLPPLISYVQSLDHAVRNSKDTNAAQAELKAVHKQFVEKYSPTFEFENKTYEYKSPEAIKLVIEKGNLELFKKMLEKGLKPNDLIYKDSISPLFYACTVQNNVGLEILKYLHHAGASLINKENVTAGHIAAMNGNKQCLEYCLQNGVNIDAVDNNGRTMFNYAVEHGQIDIAKYLLEKNKNLIISKNDIIAATKNAHFDCVKLILEKSPALISSKDEEGNSLIHNVCLKGSGEITRLLLSSNAVSDSYLKNKNMQLPLHLAVINKNQEVLSQLLQSEQKDSFLESKDSTGYSPAMLAMKNRDLKSLIILLNKYTSKEIIGNYIREYAVLALNESRFEQVEELVKLNPSYFNSTEYASFTIDFVKQCLTKHDLDIVNEILNANQNNLQVILGLLTENNKIELLSKTADATIFNSLLKLISKEALSEYLKNSDNLIIWMQQIKPALFVELPMQIRQFITNSLSIFDARHYIFNAINNFDNCIFNDAEVNKEKYLSAKVNHFTQLANNFMAGDKINEVITDINSISKYYSLLSEVKSSEDMFNQFMSGLVLINKSISTNYDSKLHNNLIKSMLAIIIKNNKLSEAVLNQASPINPSEWLELARKTNDIEAVKFICHKYPETMTRFDQDMVTPLFKAINEKQYELAEVLIDMDKKGESYDRVDTKGWGFRKSAFGAAVTEGLSKLCEKMLEKRGKDLNNHIIAYDVTPLAASITYNKPDITQLLLKHGISIYDVSVNNSSVIQQVLENSRGKDILELIKLIDVEKAKNILIDLINSIPNLKIPFYNFETLLKTLPEILNLKDNNGQTVKSKLLHKAIQSRDCRSDIVEYFSKNKFDLSETNEQGKSIFDVAIETQHRSLFLTLYPSAQHKDLFAAAFIRKALTTGDFDADFAIIAAANSIENNANEVIKHFTLKEKEGILNAISSESTKPHFYLQLVESLAMESKESIFKREYALTHFFEFVVKQDYSQISPVIKNLISNNVATFIMAKHDEKFEKKLISIVDPAQLKHIINNCIELYIQKKHSDPDNQSIYLLQSLHNLMNQHLSQLINQKKLTSTDLTELIDKLNPLDQLQILNQAFDYAITQSADVFANPNPRPSLSSLLFTPIDPVKLIRDTFIKIVIENATNPAIISCAQQSSIIAGKAGDLELPQELKSVLSSNSSTSNRY